jgi:hypothetical protein
MEQREQQILALGHFTMKELLGCWLSYAEIQSEKGEVTMQKGFIALCATTVMVGALVVSAPSASAYWFSRHHPRRAEVNHREWHQQGRINQGIHNGSLSPQEARQLESQERALRQQEHADVRANGGYLTRGQQRQLNQEQDTLSHEIYQDKHN